MSIAIDLQIVGEFAGVPKQKDFEAWVNVALQSIKMPVEICIRIVDESEITSLNEQYRHKKGPTNILTSPYEIDEEKENYLLGDLVICADVMQREAAEQKINLQHHWAHIVVHGCLHLLGYTHDTDEDAEKMERLEQQLLNGSHFNF